MGVVERMSRRTVVALCTLHGAGGCPAGASRASVYMGPGRRYSRVPPLGGCGCAELHLPDRPKRGTARPASVCVLNSRVE